MLLSFSCCLHKSGRFVPARQQYPAIMNGDVGAKSTLGGGRFRKRLDFSPRISHATTPAETFGASELIGLAIIKTSVATARDLRVLFARQPLAFKEI